MKSFILYYFSFFLSFNVFASTPPLRFNDSPIGCESSEIQMTENFKTVGSGIRTADNRALQFVCVGTWKKDEQDPHLAHYTPGNECQIICPLVYSADKQITSPALFAIRLNRDAVPTDEETGTLLDKNFLHYIHSFQGALYQDGSHEFGFFFQLFKKRGGLISKSIINRNGWNWIDQAPIVSENTFQNYLSFINQQTNAWGSYWSTMIIGGAFPSDYTLLSIHGELR